MMETAQYIQPKDYSSEIEVLTKWFSNPLNMNKLAGFLVKNYRINYQYFRDIAQEVYLKAYIWINENGLPQKSPINNWIYSIAENHVLDLKRKEKREPNIVGEMPETIDSLLDTPHSLRTFYESPERPFEIKEELNIVLKALGLLPPDKRSALILFVYHGMNYEQIADFQDVPRGTVMSRLYYARKALRDRMESILANGHDQELGHKKYPQSVESNLQLESSTQEIGQLNHLVSVLDSNLRRMYLFLDYHSK